ncbi:MAG: hypothetical protein K2I68_01435, partial [Bacteroidales bacterium]|nr:hypothetical protein [Bacteroidales bacterium]
MKKHLFALSLSLCMAFGLGSTAFGQTAVEKDNQKNGTPQAPNYDFETWDNGAKPWGWNSSTTAELGNAPSEIHLRQSVAASPETRPSSKGQTSAKITNTNSDWLRYNSALPWDGYTVKENQTMGTLTNGALYYWYFKDPNRYACIYTETSDNTKKWAFNGRPDSVVFWVKKGPNGGRQANFTLYLHRDEMFANYNNGSYKLKKKLNSSFGSIAKPTFENTTVIGSASCKITNTDWQRISLPINYASNETPAYLLVSFTAGNNFREVVEGDELYVDDMLLIYK